MITETFSIIPPAINYLLKKLATNQAIIKFDAAILHYKQLLNRTPQQYFEDLIYKSCNVANVYEEGTLNGVFIKDSMHLYATACGINYHRTHRRT